MALTESQKNTIARKRIEIERVRKKIENLKADKKRITEQYNKKIKNTSVSNQKRTYRERKIKETNRYTINITREQDKVKRLREAIKKIRSRA